MAHLVLRIPSEARLSGCAESHPRWPERKALASLHLPDEVTETRPCGSVSGGTGTVKVQLCPLCHAL